MRVVIATVKAGHEVHPIDPGQRVPLHFAQVIVPETFWNEWPTVLYTSRRRGYALNVAAGAVDWAKRNGHEVLGGDTAVAAIGPKPRKATRS